MKKATFAPAYVSMYPVLSEIAREHGYALAIHGTVSSDFDLIAVPWTDKAVAGALLVNAMAERMQLCFGDFGTMVDGPEEKPHGRMAWTLGIGNGAAIDISVVRTFCDGYQERSGDNPIMSIIYTDCERMKD